MIPQQRPVRAGELRLRAPPATGNFWRPARVLRMIAHLSTPRVPSRASSAILVGVLGRPIWDVADEASGK